MAYDGTHNVAGEGMLARTIDACMDYFKTGQRENALAFSKPYWIYPVSFSFYVKAGNPKHFNATFLTGQTIGFMDGWLGDHTCLSDIPGYDTLGQANIIYSDRRAKIFESLNGEQLDAVFIFDNFAGNPQELGFEKIGEAKNCGVTGETSLVTRKDNDLIEWWDETLTQMFENGRYYALCNKAILKHGHRGEMSCIFGK
ncbi:uncharacterized protein LOC144363058 [Saccoglossus kowalevskii]